MLRSHASTRSRRAAERQTAPGPYAALAAAAAAHALLAVACGSDPRAPVADVSVAADLGDATDTARAVYENCFNGADDDGDLLVDCADEECRGLDACSTYQCPDGDLGSAIGSAVLRASTAGANNDLAGSCGGQGGDDLALVWTAPHDGDFVVDTRWGSYDTVLYVLDGDCDGPELACNDDATQPPALESELTLAARAGQRFVIVVDGYEVVLGDDGAPFRLNISPLGVASEQGFCDDRRDNDGDLRVDCADEDCALDPVCEPLTGATFVAAGQAHTCAIGDAAWCWGAGAAGELGDGSRSGSLRPRELDIPLRAISLGDRFACGIDEDGAVWCWGTGDDDRLLDGVPTGSELPVVVPLAEPAIGVDCGNDHACAILASGAVRCWGSNRYGQHGAGHTAATDGDANHMIDIGGVVDVSCGEGHTCVARSDGSVWCAGLNGNGQLGTGTDRTFDRPQRMDDVSDVVEVAAGAYHTCARTAAGRLRCAGQNWQGQLGDGGSREARRPRDVVWDGVAAALDCGSYHCCALDDVGSVWCWGANDLGQLGTGDNAARNVPTRVRDLGPQRAIGVGGQHTCAVDADDTVRCWGANRSGQLGDGTRTDRSAPTPVLTPEPR